MLSAATLAYKSHTCRFFHPQFVHTSAFTCKLSLLYLLSSKLFTASVTTPTLTMPSLPTTKTAAPTAVSDLMRPAVFEDENIHPITPMQGHTSGSIHTTTSEGAAAKAILHVISVMATVPTGKFPVYKTTLISMAGITRKPH
jgi:hypothetical protein